MPDVVPINLMGIGPLAALITIPACVLLAAIQTVQLGRRSGGYVIEQLSLRRSSCINVCQK